MKRPNAPFHRYLMENSQALHSHSLPQTWDCEIPGSQYFKNLTYQPKALTILQYTEKSFPRKGCQSVIPDVSLQEL